MKIFPKNMELGARKKDNNKKGLLSLVEDYLTFAVSWCVVILPSYY